jgi:lipid II:glycine glycyltransferase (peptidoglycan interpeptide bridge formation enzyme)
MYIHWKKLIFKMNEIYGQNSENLPMADVNAYFQQDKLIDAAKWNTVQKESKTLCISLQKNEDQLRSELNKSTRYQINKAERDELTIDVITNPGAEDIEAFKAFFNPYAKEKDIELFQDDRVEAIRRKGMAVIMYVFHKEGQKLAGHFYFADGIRARMFYSCSVRFAAAEIPKNDIGRANRYLHWHAILFFKMKNFQIYDFFGLSMDENNKDQQNINIFKKSFGGEEVTEYRSFIPQSFKGHMLILLMKWKWRKQVEVIKGNVARKELLNGI